MMPSLVTTLIPLPRNIIKESGGKGLVFHLLLLFTKTGPSRGLRIDKNRKGVYHKLV